MLRSWISEGDVGDAEPQTLGGIPSGDLFALANAIGALLDAPVTIEDRSSRVLAFSGRQDEADASRVETILGRQVPERFSRMLSERGVFRELHRSDRPVYIEPLPDPRSGLTMLRVAIAVRAGDEFLGSIWAAVPRSAAALGGGVIYGRVPAAEDGVVRIATDFLHRVGDRMCPVVGLGPVAHDLAGIVHARACADRALRVLRERRGEPRIARL